MDDIERLLQPLLGLGIDNKEIGTWQMAARAAVVYIATVLIVRLGKKRFMGQATAFDVILGIMLGSIVSRAITGNAPFLPALAAAAALIAMHWLFSAVAMRWHGFGNAIKGHAVTMVRDGTIEKPAMRSAHMTEHDLWEDLRNDGISKLEQVAEAKLERSGKLSVIKKAEPKILEVAVADGVQTVRIRLS